MKFRELGIIEPILKSIREKNFEKPSTIQEKSIPLIIQGKDIIGGSATGSGKTLAFGAGIIQNVTAGQGIQSLILTPTRELAEQISLELKFFSRYKPLEILSVYGGVSINPQIMNLRKTDVVVGTPGRILDHIQRKTIDLTKIKIIVLDEADRMLDMGFIDDVKKIIRECPKERQTLMFSATIPSEIKNLINQFMKNPIQIAVESYVDHSKLKQYYYDVPSGLKFSLLVHLIKAEKKGLVMVFCNSRRNTDFVAENLSSFGIESLSIHGGLTQDKRSKIMDLFKSPDKIYALCCTDVAARGLDIKGVSHIYNYDIPGDSKQYIHRIGRTARAGKEGKAINILASQDHDNFRRVLSDSEIKVTKLKAPFIERLNIKNVNIQTRSASGRRPSYRGGKSNGPRSNRPRSNGPRSSGTRTSGPRTGNVRPTGYRPKPRKQGQDRGQKPTSPRKPVKKHYNNR